MLDQIEAFVLVVQLGSFVSAAKQMQLSAAAMSKKIKSLERYLNVQLLVRTTRQVKLTEGGELFYLQCQEIMHAVQEAQITMQQFTSEPIGTLRIASALDFGERYVLPHIKEFTQHYPKIHLELTLEDRIVKLREENYDILFCTANNAYSPVDVVQKKMMETRHVVCASPVYIQQYGLPKKPEDLFQHRYIAHCNRFPEDILQFKKQQIHLPASIKLNNSHSILLCAIQAMGIANLNIEVVADALEKKELIELLKNYHDQKELICAYYLKTKFQAPKIKCFLDFISANIK